MSVSSTGLWAPQGLSKGLVKFSTVSPAHSLVPDTFVDWMNELMKTWMGEEMPGLVALSIWGSAAGSSDLPSIILVLGFLFPCISKFYSVLQVLLTHSLSKKYPFEGCREPARYGFISLHGAGGRMEWGPCGLVQRPVNQKMKAVGSFFPSLLFLPFFPHHWDGQQLTITYLLAPFLLKYKK